MVATVLIGLVATPAWADAATSSRISSGTPYQDANAVGGIGLCDASGHQITSGSITSVPFVWRAVSTAKPPSGYGVTGRTATLYAYQPRLQTPAGEWSGSQLTGSSRYSNPDVPIAAATQGDPSLASYLKAYPTLVDGLVQLRIYLSAPHLPADSLHYAATDIRVKGNTWTQVESVKVNCTAGTSVSVETLLLSPSALHKAHERLAGTKGGASVTKTGNTQVAAPSVEPAAASVAPSHHGGSASSQWIWLSVAGLCLLLLALSPLLARRRRSS